MVVPCRWSHTGWKYVVQDPAQEKYFSHPNRVNSLGFGAKQRTGGKTEGGSPYGDDFQTSYHNFYARTASSDAKTWQQQFTKSDFAPLKSKASPAALKSVEKEQLIQWAGGLHKRSDFNKKRDRLTEWTEALFHH